MPIVSGFTPESSSVTFHVIVGLLFMSLADAVGLVIAITGATVSFTLSCKLLPNVACDSSTVVEFPASSVAVTATP